MTFFFKNNNRNNYQHLLPKRLTLAFYLLSKEDSKIIDIFYRKQEVFFFKNPINFDIKDNFEYLCNNLVDQLIMIQLK